MKKTVYFILLCAILVGLAGCGAKTPAMAADGTPWNKDWIMLGQKLGVEDPGHGFTLRDVKGAKNMYFTAWSIGEAQSYTNADGEENDVYDAQMVVLLVDSGSAEAARNSMDEWLGLAGDAYSIADTAQQVYNGQEFTVLSYTFSSENSPYARGASAFTIYGNYAISAEFACQDTFEEDEGEVLADFLSRCHYAAEQ